MPQRYPIRKIEYTSNGVENVALDEDIKAPPPGSLWDVASDGSRWVHPGGIISTPLDSSPSHVRTTLRKA